MPQASRLTSEQRSNLVAYLDGELPESDAQAIETVLATSPVARHELEALGQTWTLLDVLPHETASADFTTKTMARLPGQAVERRVSLSRLVPAALTVFGWIAVIVSAVAIGFGLGRKWLPREDTPYTQNLPLLEHLNEYQNVGSLDYLERLGDADLRPTAGRDAATHPRRLPADNEGDRR